MKPDELYTQLAMLGLMETVKMGAFSQGSLSDMGKELVEQNLFYSAVTNNTFQYDNKGELVNVQQRSGRDVQFYAIVNLGEILQQGESTVVSVKLPDGVARNKEVQSITIDGPYYLTGEDTVMQPLAVSIHFNEDLSDTSGGSGVPNGEFKDGMLYLKVTNNTAGNTQQQGYTNDVILDYRFFVEENPLQKLVE